MKKTHRNRPRVLAFACALLAGIGLGHATLRAATAATLHAEMGAGINYGQYYETDRSNIAKLPIDALKFTTIRQHGFKHVRIPVSWGLRLEWKGADARARVHRDFMDSVKMSVDRALDAGLIVILNTHHEDWFQKYYTLENNARIRLTNGKFEIASPSQGGRLALHVYEDIWHHIAERFRGHERYERLIFEGLNEPRIAENSTLGDFTNSQVNILNQQIFGIVQTYPNQGNRRVYMMTVNNANNAMSFKHLTLPEYLNWPDDQVRDQLMVTIHYYHSQDWTHAEIADKPNWGTEKDYGQLIERFKWITPDLPDKFTPASSKLVGVKVNIGEFGIRHQRPNGAGASNRNLSSVLEWYRVVAAAAKHHGHSYTVWCDNGWFRVFNRNDGTGGSFNWGDSYQSEIWKMVTLHENRWRLKSALNSSWNLASSGLTWSPWVLKNASGIDQFQQFQFQVDPGIKLTEVRDKLRYPALRNFGAGKFLDVENEGSPGDGNAIRNRDGVLDSALDHYVALEHGPEGGGRYSLTIPLPAPLYHDMPGARRVIRVPENAGPGTAATLWRFSATNATGQRWRLEQVR